MWALQEIVPVFPCFPPGTPASSVRLEEEGWRAAGIFGGGPDGRHRAMLERGGLRIRWMVSGPSRFGKLQYGRLFRCPIENRLRACDVSANIFPVGFAIALDCSFQFVPLVAMVEVFHRLFEGDRDEQANYLDRGDVDEEVPPKWWQRGVRGGRRAWVLLQ